MIVENISGLRYVREQLGYSVDDLREMLGVSKSLISQWETGMRPISSEKIKDIKKIMQVPEEFITKSWLSEVDKIRIDEIILSNKIFEISIESDAPDKVRELKERLQELEDKEKEAVIIEEIRNALNEKNKYNTDARSVKLRKIELYEEFSGIISHEDMDLFYITVLFNVLKKILNIGNEELCGIEKTIYRVIQDNDKVRQKDRLELEEMQKKMEEFKKEKKL